jgi:hypothetical protein
MSNTKKESNLSDQAYEWLQENLRLLVSLFIVAVVAFGIYSYAERTKNAGAIAATGTTSSTNIEVPNTDSEEVTVEIEKETPKPVEAVPAPAPAPAPTGITVKPSNEKPTDAAAVAPAATPVPVAVVTGTDKSVSVTVNKGQGRTHAARAALASYLSASGKTLSNEQKVYVEDYLAKATAGTMVNPGTSISFSENMIATAVTKSGELTPKQIQNLTKYTKYITAYR